MMADRVRKLNLLPSSGGAEKCDGSRLFNGSNSIIMLLVRQRNTFDCGVAVVAMLAEVPYDAVLDRLITGLSATSPLREIVVWRSLEDITQANWSMENVRDPKPKFATYRFPEAPTAAVIQRANGSRHYVAVGGGRVYDPLFEVPFEQSDYPDNATSVVTVFRRLQGAMPTALRGHVPFKEMPDQNGRHGTRG